MGKDGRVVPEVGRDRAQGTKGRESPGVGGDLQRIAGEGWLGKDACVVVHAMLGTMG